MWVFDGEEWVREGGGEEETTSARTAVIRAPRPEEVGPALQIVEIIPIPRTREVVLPYVTPTNARKPR